MLRAKLLVYSNLPLIHQFIQLALNLFTHSFQSIFYASWINEVTQLILQPSHLIPMSNPSPVLPCPFTSPIHAFIHSLAISPPVLCYQSHQSRGFNCALQPLLISPLLHHIPTHQDIHLSIHPFIHPSLTLYHWVEILNNQLYPITSEANFNVPPPSPLTSSPPS